MPCVLCADFRQFHIHDVAQVALRIIGHAHFRFSAADRIHSSDLLYFRSVGKFMVRSS